MLEREGMNLASFFLRGDGSVLSVVNVCVCIHVCVFLERKRKRTYNQSECIIIDIAERFPV